MEPEDKKGKFKEKLVGKNLKNILFDQQQESQVALRLAYSSCNLRSPSNDDNGLSSCTQGEFLTSSFRSA
ncbi:hypothetical protein PoB_002166600 [Plakobranchus ocellatus]|uniref:Uncharacterized protein n=1 Tax=Plakobranchus ocellatus TaxID=259542 RepID=A0AAV3ZGY7_9GAST|nr:hypothetical protein PoB_002166600 [Plakobranchus ocellatus]